jgi:hypothetical protein
MAFGEKIQCILIRVYRYPRKHDANDPRKHDANVCQAFGFMPDPRSCYVNDRVFADGNKASRLTIVMSRFSKGWAGLCSRQIPVSASLLQHVEQSLWNSAGIVAGQQARPNVIYRQHS